MHNLYDKHQTWPQRDCTGKRPRAWPRTEILATSDPAEIRIQYLLDPKRDEQSGPANDLELRKSRGLPVAS